MSTQIFQLPEICNNYIWRESAQKGWKYWAYCAVFRRCECAITIFQRRWNVLSSYTGAHVYSYKGRWPGYTQAHLRDQSRDRILLQGSLTRRYAEIEESALYMQNSYSEMQAKVGEVKSTHCLCAVVIYLSWLYKCLFLCSHLFVYMNQNYQ